MADISVNSVFPNSKFLVTDSNGDVQEVSGQNASSASADIDGLTFTAKTYLFGPAQTQKVIKETQTDLYTDTDTTNKAREERIIIVPNPTSADADDDFGFTTTIESYTDGKKYNTTTDSDE